MKELIQKSGLKLKEFSELYEIPYNTVRQWYNGEREGPKYIKRLIESLQNAKTKGIQLNIMQNKYFYLKTIHEKGIEETLFDNASERNNYKNYISKKLNVEFFVEMDLQEV